MTFKPAINKNVQVKDTAPVFERLANHHSSPEKSQRVQEELTKEWTFSPALSHGTQKLTAAKYVVSKCKLVKCCKFFYI